MSKADEIMDVLVDVLEQSGYKLEDVHLIDFDTWKGIEKDMSIALLIKHCLFKFYKYCLA